jgi:hypothetical protein
MDREKGRLPAMQIFVEARIEYDRAQVAYSEARARRILLKRKRNEIQAQYAQSDTMEQLIERLRPIVKERGDLKLKMQAAEVKMRQAHLILTGKEKEVRQFIMKCPFEGCRGFLSSAWKCGTCQKFFCADCHAEKAGHQDDTHVCNPDAKATAAMIKQETKPCPKCGIRISKIDGCDQMWCVSCQTTFSWNSGQILLNTVVHNPHYYEYLRRNNNGALPREAGDVPCGGLPNAYLFTRLVMEIPTLQAPEKTEILDIVRCLSDIQYVRLPQFPLRQAANVNQEYDIQYLMKNLTEEQWGTVLERIETKFEQRKEIGLILQTLLHVGSEKLTQLQNSTRDQRGLLGKALLEELRRVRTYSNKSLVEKGKQMGMVVPQITKDWRWSWMRKAEMKETKEEEEQTTNEETVTSTLPPAPAPPPPQDTEDENEERIIVDIGGEMIEMTRAQAREMLNT